MPPLPYSLAWHTDITLEDFVIRTFLICILFSIGQIACTPFKSSILSSENANIIQSEKALANFVQWHNQFFSGPMRPISQAELSDFFADDIYFEVNGKKVAESIDEMVHDYGRIKNKGHKIVNIEPFDEKVVRSLGGGITEISVKHDITIIFKDDSKKVFKVESNIFIKSGKIFKYIEKFGV